MSPLYESIVQKVDSLSQAEQLQLISRLTERVGGKAPSGNTTSVFSPPGETEEALETLEQLRKSPSLVMLGDGPAHFRTMLAIMHQSGASGNLVHDAHIAALCVEHGVSEFYTMDREFARFPARKITRPF